MLIGDRLGKYEIVGKIGSGGMGEVYRAKDEQLGREVALKVLLPEFCMDNERLERFKFEAKAVSALNHPGIITIHEIVETGENPFMATEFVDGTTIRDLIDKKELDLASSIRIGVQVAGALAAAHDEGIVHRDVKPENIMIRRDGYAKILDFGLAKPFLNGDKQKNAEMLVKTQPGIVIGSVRYMSPEQARGKSTDGRTDIWSLGVVLYEMVTGKAPFDGETVSDQLAALIHKDVEIPESFPAMLQSILSKCLAKDVNLRYRNIKELEFDLRELRQTIESGSAEAREMADTIALPLQNTSENATLIHRTFSAEGPVTSSNVDGTAPSAIAGSIKNKLLWLGGFAVAAAILVGTGFYLTNSQSVAASFENIRVSKLTEDGHARNAAVSPDGKLVVYAHVQDELSRLVVMQVATRSEVEIVPETDAKFLQPSFSADGEYIYYVLKENGVGKLYKISALGGAAAEIAVDIDTRPAVSRDGKSLAFARHDPNNGGDDVLLVGSDGGKANVLVESKKIGFDRIMDVFWSSDGGRVIVGGHKTGDQQMYRTSLKAIDIVSKQEVEDPAVQLFQQSDWLPAFGFEALAGNSGFVFVGKKNADETMQVWHLDALEERIVPVTTDTSDYDTVSASPDGKTLIATKADWITGLVAYDRDNGELLQLKPDARKVFGFKGLSETPDGRIIYPARDGAEVNIYSFDPVEKQEKKLTKGVGSNLNPVASDVDGSIYFSSNRNSSYGIWKMESDGSNPVQITKPENDMDFDPVLIDDGKTVLFVRQTNDGGTARLMTVPVGGGKAVEVLGDLAVSKMRPRVSRDGKSLAYVAVNFEAETAELTSTIKFAKIDGGKVTGSNEELESRMDEWFTWSPSGADLTRTAPGSGSQLWESPIGGKPGKQLTALNSGSIRSFAWSKDGTQIFIVKGTTNSDLVLVKAGEST